MAGSFYGWYFKCQSDTQTLAWPFKYVPFMECRHSVWSMRHSVSGTVYINGQEYSFQNAWGYWEGDRGHSFPKEYLWTQCCFDGGSLMLSVAEIPIAGFLPISEREAYHY